MSVECNKVKKQVTIVGIHDGAIAAQSIQGGRYALPTRRDHLRQFLLGKVGVNFHERSPRSAELARERSQHGDDAMRDIAAAT